MSMPTYFDRFNHPEDTAGWGIIGFIRVFRLNSVFIYAEHFSKLHQMEGESSTLVIMKIDYSWGAV